MDFDFDYSEYEYITECVDGCGEISAWLQSKDVAHDLGRVHEGDKGHHWVVKERMRQ